MIQFKVEAHNKQQPASSQSSDKTAVLALGFSLPGVCTRLVVADRKDTQHLLSHSLTLITTCPESLVLLFWKVSESTEILVTRPPL